MKITKSQLKKIIREERARLMEQPDIPDVMGAMGGGKFQPRSGLDPAVAKETMEELKAKDAFDTIQDESTKAATIIGKLSDDMDVALMDAGLNELAMELRKAEEVLDNIRQIAFTLRV